MGSDSLQLLFVQFPVYATNPQTITDLKNEIRRVINELGNVYVIEMLVERALVQTLSSRTPGAHFIKSTLQ